MAGIVPSLFGPTPEELMSLKRREEAQTIQQAGQSLGPRGAAGAALGTALGRGANYLFNLEDPAVKQATDVYATIQRVQNELGEDIKNPTILYPALAKGFADANLPEMASKVMMEGYDKISAYEREQAATTKDLALAEKAARENDPKTKTFWTLVGSGKVSPASVKAALDADMDFSLLDINDKEKKSTMALQLEEAGYTPGSAEFKKKMNDFIDSDIKGKSKGTGNVMIGSIGMDTGKAGEAAGKVIGEQIALIEKKYEAIDYIKGAKTKLSQGINAGIYGPTKQFVTKATGGMIGSKEKVINTEKFLSDIGNTVIPRLSEFGGNDSVEELKYLRDVMAGNITLEPEAIKGILDDAEIKIKRGIERLERQKASAGTKEGLPLDKGPSRAAEEAAAPKPKRRVYVIGEGFKEAP
jgi:hypothetical protein